MNIVIIFFDFFFFKQKTAYEMSASLVGSEMCIRDRTTRVSNPISTEITLVFLLNVVFCFLFSETGFLCVALAVLELTL